MANSLPETRITPAIRAEAARLFGDRIAGALSAQDEARLTQWLAADDRHARAFATVEQMWMAIDGQTMPLQSQVPIKNTGIAALRRPGRLRWTRRLEAPRRRWAQGAMAASVALIALWQLGDVGVRLQADARTGTGEQQMIALSDGSTVLLNTGSAIVVDYGRERRLRLLRGEAAFTVAPDRARPFVVEADGASVTALGTRFLVRVEDDTRIAVTEHSVRVEAPGGEARVVREGEMLRYGDGVLAGPKAVSVAETDAWTRGVIRVVNQPLGNVVREIGRYHRGYIGIVGGKLAARPVNGVFHVADPMRSIDAIEKTLGIHSTRMGEMVVLLHD